MSYFTNNFVLAICLILSLPGTSPKLHPFFDSTSLSVLCYRQDRSSGNNGQQDIGPCPLAVEELRSARQEIATIGNYYTEPPEWFNITLATIGQNFMRKNLVGFLYSAGIASLLTATSVDALRILASAGNVTRHETASKRYIGNLLHFIFWSNGDIGHKTGSITSNSYRWNQSSLFESLNLIRSVHEKIAHQSHQYDELFKVPVISRERFNVKLNERLWDAFEKDIDASDLRKFKNNEIFPPRTGGTQYYLNQFSMIVQYWAFVALPIMKPEVGLFVSKPNEEELLGYLHFWGLLAHVMGQKVEYNICLQPDVQTAKIYFRKIFEEYFAPGLFQMDYETKVLLEASVKGISKIYPFVDETITLKQFCQDLLWIRTDNIQRVLSPQARVYNSILRNFRFLTKFGLSNSALKFVFRGMLQVGTINNLRFNVLQPRNFTDGIISYDESVLDSANLFPWLNNEENPSVNFITRLDNSSYT